MNLFDNFERADGVNVLAGSTLSGGGATWQKVNGVGTSGRGVNAGILTGQAYFDTNPNGNTIIVAESGSNEVEATFTYSEALKNTYFIYRYIDENNYFYLNFNTAGVFAKHVSGGVTDEFRGVGLALGDTYKLTITNAGLYVGIKNGNQDFSATRTELNAGTKNGFSADNSTVRIPEFSSTDNKIAKFIGIVSPTASGTVNTATGAAIGLAVSTRRVIVVVASPAKEPITSASIGGVSATIQASHVTTDGQFAVFSAVVPTGTTANIVVNTAVAETLPHYFAVYTIDNGSIDIATLQSNGLKTITSGTSAVPYTGIANGITLVGLSWASTLAKGTISSSGDYTLDSGASSLRLFASRAAEIAGARSFAFNWTTDLTAPAVIGAISIAPKAVIAATPPVNTVPTAQTAVSGTAKAITGISVNDVNGNLVATKLTASGGLLNVSLAGGAVISAGANNSATLTLGGTQAKVNTALGTLTYTHTTVGSFTITVLSSDNSPTPLTDSDVINVTVDAADAAPVNTVPSTQNAGVNVAKAITGISVNDVNNNLSTTKLTASNGTISVSLAGGATISLGANNSSTLTLSGTQAQINSALATVSYTGTVVGTQTITVLSTDSTATPLTDSDVISITVKDVYSVAGTTFKTTGVLSNGVFLDSNGKWAIPTGTTTWTFTAQKLSADHIDPIALSLSGVSSTSLNNQASNIFITEAAHPLLTAQQRTDVETVGGGYPLFVVTKNANDTTNAFDVLMATTSNGTYTTYLTDQSFSSTAIVSGNIERTHPTFAINGESNMPATISVATKSLLYTNKGQSEWFELSSLSTQSDETNTSSVRLVENSRTAIWDTPMPIALDFDEVGRIALLNTPSIGTTVLADGVQRFFKIIPKIIGGASLNPALVTPIALTITSRSRRPFPVRDVKFTRNTPNFGSAFPEHDIDFGSTEIYVYPSSRTETVTSGFFNPATAFEAGVTQHVDVKTVGGETLIRTLDITNGTHASYSVTQRALDIARYSTQYEVYTKKNGIESARFVHVVQQTIFSTDDNTVTAVAMPTFVTNNIRTTVTLRAATAGQGTGQETGVYLMKLSGTLFPTVNMDAMSIDAGKATISSYDKTTGELIVLAPRSTTDFILIAPFTGTGTISVFAGKRYSAPEEFQDDEGFTGTATI